MISLICFAIVSTVSSATFYPNQILVTEEATLTISTSKTVTITGLPGDLDPSSFRVFGEGFSIGEVTLDAIYLKEPKDPKVKRIITRIDSLEERIKAIDDRINALRAKEEFLNSIKVTIPKKLSSDLYEGKVNSKEWQEAMRFIFDGAVNIKAEVRDITRMKKRLMEEIANLRERLYRIAPYYKKRSYTAEIEVSITRTGTYRLGIEYLIPNGGWRPYYEFRPIGDRLEIGCFGKVIQRSGRDWNNIKVELTTSRPAIGTTPPPISGWYLRTEEPYAYDEKARRKSLAPAVTLAEAEEAKKEAPVEIEEVGTAV
ncbi:MAG TPA: mucoidy inhibitor MuiA family protein, partial [bacterium (Candidatus Stahlbacteria)]|nr:mucoidy inhibitor MuiA family protein [Candidatus Stahlbacteria bacterium]